MFKKYAHEADDRCQVILYFKNFNFIINKRRLISISLSCDSAFIYIRLD